MNAGRMVIRVKGAAVLADPLTNKGTAFSAAEREALDLDGLLPPAVCSMAQQLDRVYQSFQRKATPIERYIYLAALQDRNETLFYRLLHEHLYEMMPIVYTPVVGEACQGFSHHFRRPPGLFHSYEQRHTIGRLLRNPPGAPPPVPLPHLPPPSTTPFPRRCERAVGCWCCSRAVIHSSMSCSATAMPTNASGICFIKLPGKLLYTDTWVAAGKSGRPSTSTKTAQPVIGKKCITIWPAFRLLRIRNMVITIGMKNTASFVITPALLVATKERETNPAVSPINIDSK